MVQKYPIIKNRELVHMDTCLVIDDNEWEIPIPLERVKILMETTGNQAEGNFGQSSSRFTIALSQW